MSHSCYFLIINGSGLVLAGWAAVAPVELVVIRLPPTLCGSEPARESGLSANINVEGDGPFASRLAPTGTEGSGLFFCLAVAPIVVLRQPLHGSIAIAAEPLVIDQLLIQITQHPMHASRPRRVGGDVFEAEQVGADRKDNRVTARQTVQRLQLDAQVHQLASVFGRHDG